MQARVGVEGPGRSFDIDRGIGGAGGDCHKTDEMPRFQRVQIGCEYSRFREVVIWL